MCPGHLTMQFNSNYVNCHEIYLCATVACCSTRTSRDVGALWHVNESHCIELRVQQVYSFVLILWFLFSCLHFVWVVFIAVILPSDCCDTAAVGWVKIKSSRAWPLIAQHISKSFCWTLYEIKIRIQEVRRLYYFCPFPTCQTAVTLAGSPPPQTHQWSAPYCGSSHISEIIENDRH